MTRLPPYIIIATALMSSVVIGLPAHAVTPTPASTTAPWQQMLSEARVVRGTFTQRKYLAGLDQPLVSTGHFVVAADHGLIWQIEKPVAAQLVVTQRHLVQRNNGHVVAQIDTRQQPALHVVAALLLAVFQADTTALQQYFSITGQQVNAEHWSLRLTPRSASVGDFISGIRIAGGAHVEHIEIRQANGDRSVIDLQTGTNESATLSASERALFGQ